MVTREQRLACAYLLRVAEPPACALRRFVAEHGVVAAAEAVRVGDVPEAVEAETSARRHVDTAAEDLAVAERVGARLVTPEDEDWPAWPLLPLTNAAARGLKWASPPLGLWVRGTVPLVEALQRAVSVVGARAATSYGEHVAAELGYGLASRGMTVVSGAAYGIDGAAHKGALNTSGCTVAVLACGIDRAYPAGHSALIDRIAAQGLVITEYPPGTTPARHRFLVRNRIIAALGAGTVVVEAGQRSGARNTAASAAALGRVLMVVPGPVTSAMSMGCHDLLREGLATSVSSVAEVVESVGLFGEDLVPRTETSARPTDGLDSEALRVHEALEPRAAHPAERIAEVSGVPLPRVRAVLPALELTGLADRCESGWRLSPPA
ncbi:DNA protecting protein DprA [Actinosynnema sp. ALI-1.44]|uniref:DNA-processing protein DprA n=1 Tax=Actinosynnema sp. ALI-1.44 TaxID=1933779 RepID=UPI00097C48CD|nr:DNA-processing protein DprA [Actinosynnema sp. ALI-1.44]ONI70382.1 DNA protecting protein DprA [Actinosynnema sp. ALI-1.44]